MTITAYMTDMEHARRQSMARMLLLMRERRDDLTPDERKLADRYSCSLERAEWSPTTVALMNADQIVARLRGEQI